MNGWDLGNPGTTTFVYFIEKANSQPCESVRTYMLICRLELGNTTFEHFENKQLRTLIASCFSPSSVCVYGCVWGVFDSLLTRQLGLAGIRLDVHSPRINFPRLVVLVN